MNKIATFAKLSTLSLLVVPMMTMGIGKIVSPHAQQGGLGNIYDLPAHGGDGFESVQELMRAFRG
jgi:hypothetical protein